MVARRKTCIVDRELQIQTFEVRSGLKSWPGPNKHLNWVLVYKML
jgi:hypothetical protein